MPMSLDDFEEIRSGDRLLAIRIGEGYRGAPGVHFFTPHAFSQQLAYMRRPAGDRVVPHRHGAIPREVLQTQEVLLVRSGRIRVQIYDDSGAHVADRELGAGDLILLAAGGQGVEVLDEAELIEVKQGPFAGSDDKIPIEG